MARIWLATGKNRILGTLTVPRFRASLKTGSPCKLIELNFASTKRARAKNEQLKRFKMLIPEEVINIDGKTDTHSDGRRLSVVSEKERSPSRLAVVKSLKDALPGNYQKEQFMIGRQ